ncbi:MAG: quinolinate synthase NadA [Negativicutes bacterium]|nr:quinolinate synthase NadA [Negativicutes bacterium]
MLDIKDRIKQLKREKNVVILAHYYVPGEVQEVADYLGDSYYLSKIVTKVDAKIIVFCGVYFMGESAKIMNPEKIILMPDLSSDCPMAHMAQVAKIEDIRKKYEDLAVVCYINSTAEIKANSDACVTSSNALKVVKALPNKYIYFVPDRNLGRYVSQLIPEKTFILNDGYCHVHDKISAEDVLRKKREYPEALIVAHPECKTEVLELADYIGSTSGIINYIEKSGAKDFIVCTETGVFHELKKITSGKNFHAASDCQICPDMKKNTLEKVLQTLENLENEVYVDRKIAESSINALERMLQLSEVKEK